jgi:hypothetical protein
MTKPSERDANAAKNIREGCLMTFMGGYQGGDYETFKHGMETVCNVLDQSLPNLLAQAREEGRLMGLEQAAAEVTADCCERCDHARCCELLDKAHDIRALKP